MRIVRYNTTMYNSLAFYYDELVKDDQATIQWVNWIEEVLEPSEILDCACGSGEIDGQLKKLGYKVSALDLSQEMIQVAQKKNVLITTIVKICWIYPIWASMMGFVVYAIVLITY